MSLSDMFNVAFDLMNRFPALTISVTAIAVTSVAFFIYDEFIRRRGGG